MPTDDPRKDSALRRLVDRVPDVVFRFSLTPEPHFEYISNATTRLLGYTPEEFYAEPELGLSTVHPDDRARLTEIVQTGVTEPALIRYLRKDGSLAWAEVKLNPLYRDDDETEPIGVDGVVREVTGPVRPGGESVTHAFGGIELHLVERRVTVDGKPVHLTPAEFRLLTVLMEKPGQVFSRDELMQRLWRSSHTGDGHTCEAHISNLRKKIEPDPRHPTRIVTVRGGGYQLSV